MLVGVGQDFDLDYVPAQRALWTFDVTTSTWQQRSATGSLPDPSLACAFTIYDGKGVLLSNSCEWSEGIRLYQLDLTSWHWTIIPKSGHQPRCFDDISAVQVEVRFCCM